MRRALDFLLRREVVLAAFLGIKLVAVVLHGLSQQTTDAWGTGILALLTYGVIAWFAHKRAVISIWAISLLMLNEAAATLTGAWARLDASPVVAVVGLAVAVYIILGALVVFSSRRQSE